MRFRQFIESENQYSTEGGGNYKVKRLDAQQLADWAEANCRSYLRGAKHRALFRGMQSGVLFGLKDTNDFTRTSANTENYYTLWMDNASAWKGWPKRSKSYICTSRPSTADVYGDVHFVLVPDDLKVGVCPNSDLWTSFRPEIDSLDDLMLDVHTAFKWLDIEQPTTADSLHRALEDVTTRQLEKAQASLTIKAHQQEVEAAESKHRGSSAAVFNRYANAVASIRRLLESMEKEGASNLFVYFTRIFVPSRYNFELEDANNLLIASNREAWVQGEVGLVNLNAFSHSENTDPMNDMFEKYDLHRTLGL
jgi:hypothetical protein